MEEDWNYEDEELETASLDDKVIESNYHSRIHKSVEDEEKEELIDRILEWDRRLNEIKRKTRLSPQYRTFPYQDRNLYSFSKAELRKLLKNVINQLIDILRQMGYDLSDIYAKYHPRKYRLKPGYAKYWVSKIAPSRLGQTLFPHFLSEVTLDELDMEHLSFIGTNLSSLCQLELTKLEWLIEDGKVKESDVIKTIRKDLLQRSDVDPQLRKEVEDELIRYELSHKPEKQRLQLQKMYQQFYEVMRQRDEVVRKQQEQILSDGFRRRKELEELKQGKPLKGKEMLGTSAAEEICKRLSSEARRKRNKS